MGQQVDGTAVATHIAGVGGVAPADKLLPVCRGRSTMGPEPPATPLMEGLTVLPHLILSVTRFRRSRNRGPET